MNKYQWLSCIFLTLLLARDVNAQVTPASIPVDTISIQANVAIPFDKPFVLQLQGSEARSVYTGAVAEWRIKHKQKVIIQYSGGPFLATIRADQIYHTKQGVNIYIEALPPNKNIAILLGHHYDGDLISQSLFINWLFQTGNNQVVSEIDRLERMVYARIQGGYDFSATDLGSMSFSFFGWPDKHSGYQVFFQSTLSSPYDLLFNPARPFLQSFNYALTIQNLFDMNRTAATQRLSSVELNVLVGILRRNILGDIMKGSIPIAMDFEFSRVADHRIDLRLANLKTSLKAIEKLSQFVEQLMVYVSPPTDAMTVLAELDAIKTRLSGNIQIMSDNYQTIIDSLASERALTYTTWAFGSNEVLDLSTRGTYQIIPSLGVVSILGVGNKENELLVRPVLGANIYLRPVDKSIPFNRFPDFKTRFLHQFSFNLGVTAAKISRGEFSDLYGSLSLLAGGNYKISQGIAISFGTTVMLRKNINPAINEAKPTYLNPYLGLSFDLDLMNAIQKLTSKFY